MYENCVSFTGHRQAPYSLMEPLDRIVGTLIEQGFTTFYSGMALGFDMMAAEAVLKAKQTHPKVKLIAVLPFPEQDSKFSEQTKLRYRHILSQADKTVITSPCYTNAGVYHIRNRYLVDHCSLIVCYFNGTPGGTQKTLEFAQRSGKQIITLNP